MLEEKPRNLYARLLTNSSLTFECPWCRSVDCLVVRNSLRFPTQLPCSICGSTIELSIGMRTIDSPDLDDDDDTTDGTLVDNPSTR